MSEVVINSISSVRATEPGMPTRLSQPVQTESSANQKPELNIQNKKTAMESKTVQPAESAPVMQLGNNSNISLKFRVDEKTKDVTIFVVDRKSKKVLRTIPASELSQLSAGDLVKLTA